jgi:hypothetical protein
MNGMTRIKIMSILLMVILLIPTYIIAEEREHKGSSSSTRGRKNPKHLDAGYTTKIQLHENQKKVTWISGDTNGMRSYIRIMLDGRKMSGSIKVELFNGRYKKLRKQVFNFKKDCIEWAEYGKKVKGKYFVKITQMNKATGIVRVKNSTVTYKERFNKKMLTLVNKERKEAGLEPCFWDKSMEKAIMTRAKDLSGRFSHDRPNGKSYDKVYGRLVKENISTAIETKWVFDGWMKSPGHRAAIMMEWTDSYAKKITYGFVCATNSRGTVMSLKEYI